MKNLFASLVLVVFSASQVTAGTVYQDDFDNDGLAANSGVGGGIEMGAFNSKGIFSDNGNLTYSVPDLSTSGTRRRYANSIDSFFMPSGFTLDVTFSNSFLTGGRFQFGLVDASQESSLNLFTLAHSSSTIYGIGLTTVTTDGLQGLTFGNGTSPVSLSNAQSITTGNNHTFSLTVGSNDSYSYSVNGATPTTGEIIAGAGSFDLSRNYLFFVASQAGHGFPMSLQSVSLAANPPAVPEPSTLVLLLTGGIGLAYFQVRRKRSRK